jgi:import inner membrane translocase subunit TIM16
LPSPPTPRPRRYFESNQVEKGGSFYIQSKVYRANELLEQHFKEMESKAKERMQSGGGGQ